jgi:Uncharacterized protein conserved in bacteria (DUF2325)
MTAALGMLAVERARAAAAERHAAALAVKTEAVEAALTTTAASVGDVGDQQVAGLNIAPRTVLYVGGRTGQAASLRRGAARFGTTLLHHDGGTEASATLLAGLVGRADLVVFPVDCVSHEAALTVKRLCRQTGRPFVPLRSAGLSSLLTALARSASVDI